MEDRTNDQRVKTVVFDLYGVIYTHRADGDVQKSDEVEERFWQEHCPEEWKTYKSTGNVVPLLEKEEEIFLNTTPDEKCILPVFGCYQAPEFARHVRRQGREMVVFSNMLPKATGRLFSYVTGVGIDDAYCKCAADFGPKKDPESWRKMFQTLPVDASIDLVLEDGEKNLLAAIEAGRSLGHETVGYKPATCPFGFVGSKGFYIGYFREAAAELLK